MSASHTHSQGQGLETGCGQQRQSSLESGFQVQDFGMADYRLIWKRQKAWVDKRLKEEVPDAVLVGEHFPVITMGRGSHSENLLAPHIPTVAIERGGDVTYHGPGQIVAYPILQLPEGRRDLHQYLRLLEEAVIRTLLDFGIEGLRNPGYTGVWVKSKPLENEQGDLRKICAIGVAVKRWVTYHGLSLNVDCDLSAYAQINPCGLESTIMTRMSDLISTPIHPQEVKTTLSKVLFSTLPFSGNHKA
ncbi:MAG: lipoyl(octanoyl) transferase LipB [Vampirovibrionales bacterium]|nr:lipoyl(octanoyl) transferase LipB [Vampirovibrionales bacterium]